MTDGRTVLGAKLLGVASVALLAGAAKIMYFGDPRTNAPLPWATTATAAVAKPPVPLQPKAVGQSPIKRLIQQ